MYQFARITEADFGISEPISEVGSLKKRILTLEATKLDDQSLGESNFPLTYEWIKEHIVLLSLAVVGFLFIGSPINQIVMTF